MPVSRRGRRLAVQVRRGGLPLPVPEAREEGRRRRRLAITQVGWDARKFGELKRYLDERGLATPVLGNVYVLGPRAAERMATGQPPGCWVSPALLETVRQESRGAGRRSARAARARRAHGRGAARARLRRRVHRRHPRRRAGRVDHPARGGARAAVGGAGRGAPLRDADGFYLYGRAPGDRAAASGGAAAEPPRSLDRARSAGPRPARSPVPGRRATRGSAACSFALPAWADRRPAVAPRCRARRAGREAPALRLPGVRQLRARPPRVRVPADLSQADAQRAVRRHASSGAARSSTSRASGSPCLHGPRPPGASMSSTSTCRRPTAR